MHACMHAYIHTYSTYSTYIHYTTLHYTTITLHTTLHKITLHYITITLHCVTLHCLALREIFRNAPNITKHAHKHTHIHMHVHTDVGTQERQAIKKAGALGRREKKASSHTGRQANKLPPLKTRQQYQRQPQHLQTPESTSQTSMQGSPQRKEKKHPQRQPKSQTPRQPEHPQRSLSQCRRPCAEHEGTLCIAPALFGAKDLRICFRGFVDFPAASKRLFWGCLILDNTQSTASIILDDADDAMHAGDAKQAVTTAESEGEMQGNRSDWKAC